LLEERRPCGEEVTMTTEHVPYTPPMWRRFLSLPHTRLGWWAVGLTAVPFALSFMLNRFGGLDGVVADAGLAMMIPVAGLLPGAVVGLIALLRSQEERSVLVWLAMVPAALVAVIPIVFMAQFVSYQVSHDLSIVDVLPVVVMTAGVVALHFVQRGSERYGLGGTISSAVSLIGVALIVVGTLIGYVTQEWEQAPTILMGAGLWAELVGLTALSIITLYARVVPWWGRVALIVGTPLGGFILGLLFYFIPESHNAHAPEEKIAKALDLTGSAEQWFNVAWDVAWGVVPWVVVGIAVFLAARRLTERPAKVR
jgi:hypothetical protein